MCYIITDGNNYISTKSGIHSVPDIKNASEMNLMKASNVLKSIPKTLLNIGDWTILTLPEKDIQEEATIHDKAEFMDINTMIDEIKNMSVQAEKLAKYSKSINSQLREIGLEIEDMYHYIEFSTFNAAQGYKAYKLLREKLIKRRHLKDEQILLDSIQEKNMLTCTQDHIDETVNKLESRSYKPRVLKELFSA